jgi:cytochrome bd-type quinol oxidase subunit 2
MRRALVIGSGVLVTVAGVIFALQGLGYVHGSVMTGTTLWTVLGPLIALCGLCIIALGFRVSRR